ncbi:MAG: hypothetical protein IH606_08695 [Burkholderiales bacterium]|nr:hypothetical protein [Burkholderiales bacterium]
MITQAEQLPKFKAETDERAFRVAKGSDSTEYLEWAKTRRVVLPNLKPSTNTISLRLTRPRVPRRSASQSPARGRGKPFRKVYRRRACGRAAILRSSVSVVSSARR